MASYRGHLLFSASLGAAYGGAALVLWDFDWGPAALAAGLTTAGGLLPDLDSDSGVPVRELFGLLATVTPFFLYQPLRDRDLSLEQTLAVLLGVYLLIRYVLSGVFNRLSVHRGMFHSIPGMLIAGLAVYLAYPGRDVRLRAFFAGGVMLGFLSHLVLDELCSVNFMGLHFKLNKYAGSALKFFSPSWPATLLTYLLLGLLGYWAWLDWPR
jgi:hypothetical protein